METRLGLIDPYLMVLLLICDDVVDVNTIQLNVS